MEPKSKRRILLHTGQANPRNPSTDPVVALFIANDFFLSDKYSPSSSDSIPSIRKSKIVIGDIRIKNGFFHNAVKVPNTNIAVMEIRSALLQFI